MPRLAPRTIGVIFMLINVLVWGAALPIVKPALSITTPFQFLFYRFIFASLFAAPIIIYYLNKKWSLIRQIPKIIFLEIFNTVLALGFIYEGLDRTTSIEAGLIANSLPFFLTLGGIFLLHEREEKHEWLGLIIALLGTLFITLEPALDGSLFNGEISLTGNLFVLGHNFAMTAYLLGAKRNYRRLPKFFTTSISFILGLLVFGALSMFKENLGFNELAITTLEQLSQPAVLWPSLYMGFFGSVIGLTAYIIGQSKMEASEAGLFAFLQPLVYIPLAVVFLHEPITPGVVVALIAIVTGVIVAETHWGHKNPTRRVRRSGALVR